MHASRRAGTQVMVRLISVAGSLLSKINSRTFSRRSALLPGTIRLPQVRRYQSYAIGALTLLVFAVGCGPAQGAPSTDNGGGNDMADVTVPDEISDLDAAEVEQRLERLFDGESSSSLAAQEIEPTETSDEPTIDEILELLNSATPEVKPSEITISVSSRTLSGLRRPVLLIATNPAHGTAEIVGINKIVYIPDSSGEPRDSFEYELYDGDEFVFAQVVEVRR